MQEFLPLFPLNLVAFPGEPLNLHIFEPRYRQLIDDCMKTDGRFGIPAYVNEQLDWGTEMRVIEISKEYEDGPKDIKTIAQRVFRVQTFENPWADKLYSGGIVAYESYVDDADPILQTEIIELLKELYKLVNIEGQVIEIGTKMYELSHKIGLSKEQEYDFLKLNTELQRQQFVFEHVKALIPTLINIQIAKERIKLNGHFKTLDPLDF
jgi:Lon protease-like protein